MTAGSQTKSGEIVTCPRCDRNVESDGGIELPGRRSSRRKKRDYDDDDYEGDLSRSVPRILLCRPKSLGAFMPSLVLPTFAITLQA